MRVLIVHPSFYLYGGAEHLIVKLCEGLRRRDVECGVLTTSILPEVASDLNGIPTEVVPVGSGRRVPKGRKLVRRQIQVLSKAVCRISGRYDLLNVHNFPAEFIAPASAKPVVWMCNEPELYLRIHREHFKHKRWKARLFYRRLFRRQKKIIKRCISEVVVSDRANAQRFASVYGRTPVIVPYGIDWEFFSQPAGGAVAGGLPGDRFIVLHVGTITPFKNQLATLKAASELRREMPDLLVVFAGPTLNSGYRRMLDELIEQEGLTEHVFFTGNLDRTELRGLYHRADLLLHPVEAQGGWLSPFEMLCAGKPIVVSPKLTCAELIREEGIGTVTEAYAAAVREIRSDLERARRAAERGREFVRANLSWDRFAERLLEVFKRAADKA